MTGLIVQWPEENTAAALEMERLAATWAATCVGITRHVPKEIRNELVAVVADGFSDALTRLGGDFDRRVFTHLCGNPEDVTP